MSSRHLIRGVALAVGCALMLTGCASSANSKFSDGVSGTIGVTAGPIGVVAGQNFWGDIASQIGGDRVTVTSIISNPSADPHQYESSLSNAAAVDKAALVIENGAHYDDFIDTLLAADNKQGRAVLNVAKLVGLAGDNPNPHLWYEPAYVVAAAKAIEQQLSQADPAHAADFQANLATFLAGEQTVVGVIEKIKAKYAGEAVAYTERVPGYLIEAAGLHLGTPASFSQAIEDGSDPTPADNAAFEQAITGHRVKVLLYNGQVTDSQTTHLLSLAHSSGVPVVAVSETMPASAKNFQSWQADQATALLQALGG